MVFSVSDLGLCKIIVILFMLGMVLIIFGIFIRCCVSC